MHSLFSISTSMTCFFHSSNVGMSSLLGTDGSVSPTVLASPAWNTQACHTRLNTDRHLISLYAYIETCKRNANSDTNSIIITYKLITCFDQQIIHTVCDRTTFTAQGSQPAPGHWSTEMRWAVNNILMDYISPLLNLTRELDAKNQPAQSTSYVKTWTVVV